jgi:hypothetical protein
VKQIKGLREELLRRFERGVAAIPFEIDCPDILRHAETEGFVKGFVVVEPEVELDIVAVYTTAGTDRTITTFSTERAWRRL